MRINKFVSETGICSRREADQWVAAGRVMINGQVAELGSSVEMGDEVRVDGRALGAPRKALYIALNKPVGITSTTDPSDRGNIVDFVGHPERIFPIGRLDKDSEGLILLTNDGDVVNRILRAENRHEKEYIVTVDRIITREFIKSMASGVRILGTVTDPCRVNQITDTVFRIVLTQGLNRQIRRMSEALGYEVTRLKRVRIMEIRLGDMKPGEWRYLTPEELEALFKQLDYRPARSVTTRPERSHRDAKPGRPAAGAGRPSTRGMSKSPRSNKGRQR